MLSVTYIRSNLLGADSKALIEQRVVSVQTLSGTGALRLLFEFLHETYDLSKTVLFSKQSWYNHQDLSKSSGYTDVQTYTYFDPKKKNLHFANMMKDLESAPNGSILVLNVCGHNPTGVDPSREQWKRIGEIAVEKQFFCIFDMAYAGFLSGDPEEDAWSVRYFERLGIELGYAQSFSKNLGIYDERCGSLGIVCKNSRVVPNIDDHLNCIVRKAYLVPPNHGSKIVTRILKDQTLRKEW